MDACTLAYNKMFECGRIRELAALYPDLTLHLRDIDEHIIDLIHPFRDGIYYLLMGNSTTFSHWVSLDGIVVVRKRLSASKWVTS